MGSSTLYTVPLTIALTSVSAHPYSHKQLNANRIRFSIASRLRSASFHALTPPASIGVSGGGGGGIQTSRFGGGGGGDGGSDSEVFNTSAAAIGVADEVSDRDSEEFLILDVNGMTCGGCASSVKRILESQPKVSSAIVDLEAETATIWPIADVKEETEWRKLLGQALATHLTNCGFQSSIRG